MSRIKDQFNIGEAFSYFLRVFSKPDPNKPTSFNLKTMHFINKISILMFLVCIIVMIYRAFTR
ncbi:DUF6728 family protein [Flectobacillus major]|jgi:hypothetical protein|uniref:DUF6728 family protein n=1 Tax=Flectobacillus major TaxID=103 RepID=UPI00040BCBEC|nr:DUF6728 family protein [Flectobacillus major]